MKPLTLKKWILTNGLLLGLVLICGILFCFLGSPSFSIADLKEGIGADIFFKVRLPRMLLTSIVGCGLAASGVTFQSLLKNPMADPYILGVSGGAALGGVIAVALSLPFALVSGVAFLFALASLLLIYWLARVGPTLPVESLLLTGVMFNSFSFALILAINSLVNLGQLHQIFFLLLGSLEAQPLPRILWAGGMTLVGFLPLAFLSHRMNLIALGDEAASHMGISVNATRKLFFFSASLMVGASVSLVGLIGFVGLFVPHLMRLILGADHRLLVPASALGGALVLLICDFVARTLFVSTSLQTQLPVGVITALIGGPFFVYLLRRLRAQEIYP